MIDCVSVNCTFKQIYICNWLDQLTIFEVWIWTSGKPWNPPSRRWRWGSPNHYHLVMTKRHSHGIDGPNRNRWFTHRSEKSMVDLSMANCECHNQMVGMCDPFFWQPMMSVESRSLTQDVSGNIGMACGNRTRKQFVNLWLCEVCEAAMFGIVGDFIHPIQMWSTCVCIICENRTQEE